MPRECECGDNCPNCEGCGKPQCECVCDEGLFADDEGDVLESPLDEDSPDAGEADEESNNNW